MSVWVVRAGQEQIYLDDFLGRGRVALGWDEIKGSVDWSRKTSIEEGLKSRYPEATPATIANWTGQHWRFMHDVQLGDVVLTPAQGGKQLRVGTITGPWIESQDAAYSLERSVEWRTQPIEASAFELDIRNALGSVMTFFAPRTQGIGPRVQAVIAGGTDPGADSVPTEDSHAWVFQANPQMYDLMAAVTTGSDDKWSANQNRSRMHPGDRVWFRLSGKGDGSGAGIYAVGRIVSEVSDKPSDFGRWSVEVQYEARVDPPLLVDETRVDPTLGGCNALKGTMGTNFRLSLTEDARLEELTAERLVPVAGANAASRLLELGVLHDIAELRQQVINDVLDALRALDHKSFEHICAQYLIAVGCNDVTVTGALSSGTLGDGGIDVTGELHQAGLPPVRLRVQAKNQKAGVGPNTVTQLRGSLSPGTYGIVITTAHFTKSALEEANRPDTTRIHLVDGIELATVLAERGIGAEKQEVTITRFDPASIQEAIQAIEESATPDPV